MSEQVPIVLPELIDGADWTVKTNGLAAQTDMTNHVMYVPENGGWLEGAVQLHEMAHARWTPREKYLDDDEMSPNGHAYGYADDLELFLQACEDRRIHYLLSQSVSDWENYAQAMLEFVDAIDRDKLTPELMVSLDVAGRQSPGVPCLTYGDSKLRQIADFAEQVILSDPSDPQVAWDAAKFMRDSFQKEKDEREQQEQAQRDRQRDRRREELAEEYDDDDIEEILDQEEEEEDYQDDEDDYSDEDEDDDTPAPKSWLPFEPPLKPTYQPPQSSRRSPVRHTFAPKHDMGDNGEWCSMTIVKPELTVAIPREKIIARGKKTAKVGNIPRHAHRMLTGGAIFRAKRNGGRRIGGTVLLDASGSMRLDDRDIDELLKQIHHGTVAMYCATSLRGELTIIAKDFRGVTGTENMRIGGNNGVDGPALQWLSERPSPRAWICDGYTTGRSGAGGGNGVYGRAECAEIERKYQITRYDNIQDYLDNIPGVGLNNGDMD